MSLEIDLRFNHEYEVNPDVELPAKEPTNIFYFPGASNEGGTGGLQIEVTPRIGSSWIGVFASSFKAGMGVDGIYSCPDSKTLCVVWAGTGYTGSVDEPRSWHKIDVAPIKQVFVDTDNCLILFADYTQILAYGKTGVMWQSRVSWDGVEILGVENGFIVGRAYDPTRAKSGAVNFTVNVRTGKLEGGSRLN